jgi:hypothetical protein
LMLVLRNKPSSGRQLDFCTVPYKFCPVND